MQQPDDVEIPDLPSFLVRDHNNESEITKMKHPIKTYATDDATAQATNGQDKAKRAAPPKAPAKAKPAAKPAKVAAKVPAKAAAPAKKAAKGKASAKTRAPRTLDPTKLDQFGYRKGSLKSHAAEMYASKHGATLHEVKAQLDSTQFNLLTDVKSRGWEVKETKEPGSGSRQVTRYRIVPKK